MHTIFFDIRLNKAITMERLLDQIKKNDRMSITYKDSANTVFSFGRDYGHYGRILNVTVIAWPTVTVRNDTEIVGYCFTPQDGNSLLSSVSAATWFLYPKDYEKRIQCLRPYFFDEV
jgi:glyceraldehyde-3-phosphate dehydrogenase (NAD(P))